jgi:hypothetical protein
MSTLQILDKDTIAPFLEHPDRVLILGKSDCAACKAWAAELTAAMEDGSFSSSVPVGKLDLDQRGLGDFKKSSPWLADITDLPFNVIYVADEKQKSWAGAGVDRLKNRLERLGL